VVSEVVAHGNDPRTSSVPVRLTPRVRLSFIVFRTRRRAVDVGLQDVTGAEHQNAAG
jgi:hypothetical protein